MPYNGSGTYTNSYYPTQDRDNSIPILASKFENFFQVDLPATFGLCVTRDGQGSMTSNFNFNSFRGTNLADPIALTDAVNKEYADAKDDLTENYIWRGDSTNKKEEVLQSDFSNDLGLNINLPANYDIVYNDSVLTDTVTWIGSVRSDDNTENISSSTLITSPALTGQTAYSQWYLFIGFDNDTDKNVTLEWDTDIDGDNLSSIEGAKRRIGDDKGITFPTDGNGDLAIFTYKFGTWEFELWSGFAQDSDITLNNSYNDYSSIEIIFSRDGTYINSRSNMLSSNLSLNTWATLHVDNGQALRIYPTSSTTITTDVFSATSAIYKFTGVK